MASSHSTIITHDIPHEHNPGYWESLFDQIEALSYSFSFGADVLDAATKTTLRQYLRDIQREVENASRENVNMKLASDVALRVVGEDITCRKKSDPQRLLYEAAFIMFFALHPDNQTLKQQLVFADVETFLIKYPEFSTIKDEAEIGKLFLFRNVMVMAQQVLSARYHKNHLLDLVTRISEGKDQKYVTGGGQTPATNRRVLIYEREGDIKPVRINKDGILSSKKTQMDFDRDERKKQKQFERQQQKQQKIEQKRRDQSKKSRSKTLNALRSSQDFQQDSQKHPSVAIVEPDTSPSISSIGLHLTLEPSHISSLHPYSSLDTIESIFPPQLDTIDFSLPSCHFSSVDHLPQRGSAGGSSLSLSLRCESFEDRSFSESALSPFLAEFGFPSKGDDEISRQISAPDTEIFLGPFMRNIADQSSSMSTLAFGSFGSGFLCSRGFSDDIGSLRGLSG